MLVPVASLLALFVHEHPADHGTHHDAREIHTHFNGHPHADHHDVPAGVPTADDDDDHERPIYLGAVVGEATAAAPLIAVLWEPVQLSTPAELPAQPPVHVVHGHDPPARHSLPARAPPSHPVLI